MGSLIKALHVILVERGVWELRGRYVPRHYELRCHGVMLKNAIICICDDTADGKTSWGQAWAQIESTLMELDSQTNLFPSVSYDCVVKLQSRHLCFVPA